MTGAILDQSVTVKADVGNFISLTFAELECAALSAPLPEDAQLVLRAPNPQNENGRPAKAARWKHIGFRETLSAWRIGSYGVLSRGHTSYAQQRGCRV